MLAQINQPLYNASSGWPADYPNGFPRESWVVRLGIEASPPLVQWEWSFFTACCQVRGLQGVGVNGLCVDGLCVDGRGREGGLAARACARTRGEGERARACVCPPPRPKQRARRRRRPSRR